MTGKPPCTKPSCQYDTRLMNTFLGTTSGYEIRVVVATISVKACLLNNVPKVFGTQILFPDTCSWFECSLGDDQLE